jgi:hypothetical protein
MPIMTYEDSDFIIIYEDRTFEFAQALNVKIGGGLILLPALPDTQAGKTYADELVGELTQNRLVTIIILIDRIGFEYSREFFQQFVSTTSRIHRPIILCPVTRSLKPIDTWAKEGYYWINVNDTEKIQNKIEELREKIPGYRMDPRLLSMIKNVVETDYIKGIRDASEFHFNLLRERWQEFELLDTTDRSKMRQILQREFPIMDLNTLEMEIDLKTSFPEFLEDFSSSKLTFQEYFNKLKPGVKFYVFKLIGQVISYFDEKGYNKSEWNKHGDLRTVARSHVTQTNWVKNLLRYKIWGINETSDSIYNAIKFIKAPSQNLTMLSENHRRRVAENILKTAYDYEAFTGSIFRLFSKHITIKNKENAGIVISEILYSSTVRETWGYVEEPDEEPEIIRDDSTPQDIEESVPLLDGWTISENDEPQINVDQLAEVMSKLIRKLKQNDKGKMIGIFGNWGRGKTFLMDMIWRNLRNTSGFHKVNFHAWKFQDTPASWAYLYEAFTKEYFSEEEGKISQWSNLNNFLKLLKLNYVRLGIMSFLWPIILFVLSVIWYLLIKDWDKHFAIIVFMLGISGSTIQTLSFVKQSFSKEAKEIFKKYYTKTSFSNLLGIQAEIQKELKSLLTTWIKEENGKINERIVLFVDDIDRCNEERIISIIDSLRVMLEDDEISKRVVVLAAIDERVLKRAIKWKYHDIIMKDTELNKEGRPLMSRIIINEYMDKLFLTGINLGSLNFTERKAILGKYVGRSRVYKESNDSIIAEKKSQKETVMAKINPTSSKEIQSTTPYDNINDKKQSETELRSNRSAIDESKYDLLEEENNTLLDLLQYNDTLTPRQIRIFYYRYLLARNILKYRIGRPTQLLLKNLARFIMHYSIKGDLTLIGQCKLELINEPGEGTSFTILENNEVFSTRELVLIHEVLEIVIAY